jgi:hypothetical protein
MIDDQNLKRRLSRLQFHRELFLHSFQKRRSIDIRLLACTA